MLISKLAKNLSVATTGVAVTLAVSALSAQSATVTNGDFQAGFGGWETTGTTNASAGEALLGTNLGISDSSLESFLGLAAGTLDSLGNGNATNGSAIKQTIAVKAGDILTFDWKFSTDDYLPFNDFSFFSISSNVLELADINLVGNYGATALETLSYKFHNAGSYTLGFGVVNVSDTVGNSQLLVDNVKINSAASVPEPASILGLLGMGALGAGSAFKRKRQTSSLHLN